MNDQTAVHAIGNGSFLIYGKGADLIGLHPGDYSVPSVARLLCGDALTSDTRRIPGTNHWSHVLTHGSGVLSFEDVLDPEFNVFRRSVSSEVSIEMTLELHYSARLFRWPDANGEGDCFCVLLPMNGHYYPCTGREYRLFVRCSGCVSLDPDRPALRIAPGQGEIILVGSETSETEKHLNAVLPDIAGRSDAFWRAYLSRITAKAPENPRLESAIESVAILIRAQQSRDGGVMAGHFYPMAYVRDQAGTARGLLRLGLVDEAKAIVGFWKHKFDRFGCLYNAETMGHDEARLMFSNDEVEVPAYVMLTAFACAEAEGGIDYLRPLQPMLSWAAHVQTPHLAGGMTGFSGDETYIAGGMFPRCFLYHGSAESTMLYILSIEKYLAAFGEDRELSDALQQARSLYRENFVKDGRLHANNPAREQLKVPPKYHFGYCDACLLSDRPAPLTWLERSSDGLYRCPDCSGRTIGNIPAAEPLSLGSVALLPVWHGFDLITDEELSQTVQPFLDVFHRTGEVSSKPDGNEALGYDYALLLSCLTHLRHPAVSAVLERMLDRLDEAGAWSEYYRDGQPYNCRCRPWESAINLSAALDAAESLR